MFSLKSHEKRKEKTKRRGRHEAVQTAVGFGTSEIRQAAKGRCVRVGRHGGIPDRAKIFRWQGGAICRGTHGLCPVESVGLCARGDLQLKHGFFAHSSGKVKNAEKTTKANVPCSAKYMQKRV